MRHSSEGAVLEPSHSRDLVAPTFWPIACLRHGNSRFPGGDGWIDSAGCRKIVIMQPVHVHSRGSVHRGRRAKALALGNGQATSEDPPLRHLRCVHRLARTLATFTCVLLRVPKTSFGHAAFAKHLSPTSRLIRRPIAVPIIINGIATEASPKDHSYSSAS
jgi:hypothetical protein